MQPVGWCGALRFGPGVRALPAVAVAARVLRAAGRRVGVVVGAAPIARGTVAVAVAGLLAAACATPTSTSPPDGSASPFASGSPVPSQSLGAETPAASGSPGTSRPGASGSPEAAPSVFDPAADLAVARATLLAFAAARANGDWLSSWSLLSPYMQRRYGSILEFKAATDRWNAEGGRRFEIEQVQPVGQVLDLAGYGEVGADLLASADVARAYLAFVVHPDIPGTSAGTEWLVAAPDRSGAWRIWVLR